MRLRRIGSSMTELEVGGTFVLFSYETPVAAHVPGRGFLHTTERYSVTTSRHVTRWLDGASAETVSQDQIEALLTERRP